MKRGFCKLNISGLNKITLIYLCVPLILFLSFYLNSVAMISGVLAISVILYLIFKSSGNTHFKLEKMSLLLIFFISALWVFLSGIGGYFYQNTDWHMRNAILHDLINYSLPVRYDNGTALVYYSGIMLPSAIIGKLFYFVTKNTEYAFSVGNFANYLYCLFGIILVALNLTEIAKPKNIRKLLLILCVMCLFSGMDIILSFLMGNQVTLGTHIEWHYPGLQFSSNTTLMFWVYNQCITTWLITLLIYKKPFALQNFAFWGVLSLFFAPFPFIGHAIYMSGLCIYFVFKNLKNRHYNLIFKKIFSVQNILSMLILLPFVYTYYSSNVITSSAGTKILISPFVILFFLIECGIFLLLIYKKYRRNIIYILTFISLYIIPHIAMYDSTDFCMRASIPALFITMIMVIKFLLDENVKYKILRIVLLISLLIGAVTPLQEISRSIMATFLPIKEDYIKDQIKTLEGKIEFPCKYVVATENDIIKTDTNYCNYGALNPDDTVFFKYFAKK